MPSVGSPTTPGTDFPGHLNDHNIIKAFLDQHNNDDPDHVADLVTVDPTGLLVVTGTDVQTAVEQLDADLASRAKVGGVWTGPGTVYVAGTIVTAAGALWRAKVTHLSGATFPGAGVSWELWAASALNGLSDMAAGAGVTDYVLTKLASGLAGWAPAATPASEVAAPAVNISGTADTYSAIPAATGGVGNTVTVAAGTTLVAAGGAPLAFTVPVGPARPVLLQASVDFQRPSGANGTSGPVSVVVILTETTDATALANAGLTKRAWAVQMPLPNNGNTGYVTVVVPMARCRLAANEVQAIARTFGLLYFISGAGGTPSPVANAPVRACHFADGATGRTGTEIAGFRL